MPIHHGGRSDFADRHTGATQERSSWEHWFTDAQKVTDDAKRDLFASFKQKYDEWVLYMEDKLSGNQAAKLHCRSTECGGFSARARMTSALFTIPSMMITTG